jgi:DnaJ-domain-containing protein 1
VTDLTLDEARLMLATTDPLAAMAGAHEARLNELLANVSTESEALLAMLDGLMAADEESELVDDPTPPEDFKEVDENIETEHSCPKCGYKWSGGK